eukprot:8883-Heterococcus_DN1.PRE.1
MLHCSGIIVTALQARAVVVYRERACTNRQQQAERCKSPTACYTSCRTCIHVRPAAVVSSELATTAIYIGSLSVEALKFGCECHGVIAVHTLSEHQAHKARLKEQESMPTLGLHSQVMMAAFSDSVVLCRQHMQVIVPISDSITMSMP